MHIVEDIRLQSQDLFHYFCLHIIVNRETRATRVKHCLLYFLVLRKELNSNNDLKQTAHQKYFPIIQNCNSFM